jgi:hypothetical protein
MYFAIIDRSRYVGSLRNLFVTDDQSRRRYWFSINQQLLADPPLTGGAVYLLPSDSFSATTADNGAPTEEWTSSISRAARHRTGRLPVPPPARRPRRHLGGTPP